MTGRALGQALYRELKRAYGPIRLFQSESLISILVRTVLSQNTSDVNSDRAYASLRHTFSSWEQVLNASPRSIADRIRTGGLADIKSVRIRNLLREIRNREGRLSLARLSRMKSSMALDYLTGMKGVGIKTACCVLLFGLRRPVMPVDTHVYRTSIRLGWVSSDTAIDQAHIRLEALIPARRILAMHLYLIRLGRDCCRPARPDCPNCPVNRLCRKVGVP